MPTPSKINTLRNSKNPEDRRACIQLLKQHLDTEPADVESWFDLASCHDFLGEELNAEPAYEKALSLGLQKLPAEKQTRLIIQYGSTLRNNKKFKEAAQILVEGVQQFSENCAIKVFAALSLYNLGKQNEASRLLFAACTSLTSDQTDGYDRAIKYYVENLDDYP